MKRLLGAYMTTRSFMNNRMISQYLNSLYFI